MAEGKDNWANIATKKKKKKEPYDQKTAKLTPEEQEMRKENLEARKHFMYEPMRHLSAAISLRAISDYPKLKRKLMAMEHDDEIEKRLYMSMSASRKKKLKPWAENPALEKLRKDVAELEEFFDSEMFTSCTGFSDRNEAIRSIMKLTPGTMSLVERGLKKA